MITVAEHRALATFARDFGRTWRRELAKRWENGTLRLSQVSVSEAELALLARLKGKLGPSGLMRYQPPAKVVEDPTPHAAGRSSSKGRRSRTRIEGR